VAIRFVVFTKPMFLSVKETVTVSPGSIALLVGEQPSTIKLVEFVTIRGRPLTTTVKLLVALRRWVFTARGLKFDTTVENTFVVGSWAEVGVQDDPVG
jgi:hypothetical protein